MMLSSIPEHRGASTSIFSDGIFEDDAADAPSTSTQQQQQLQQQQQVHAPSSSSALKRKMGTHNHSLSSGISKIEALKNRAKGLSINSNSSTNSNSHNIRPALSSTPATVKRSVLGVKAGTTDNNVNSSGVAALKKDKTTPFKTRQLNPAVSVKKSKVSNTPDTSNANSRRQSRLIKTPLSAALDRAPRIEKETPRQHRQHQHVLHVSAAPKPTHGAARGVKLAPGEVDKYLSWKPESPASRARRLAMKQNTSVDGEASTNVASVASAPRSPSHAATSTSTAVSELAVDSTTAAATITNSGTRHPVESTSLRQARSPTSSLSALAASKTSLAARVLTKPRRLGGAFKRMGLGRAQRFQTLKPVEEGGAASPKTTSADTPAESIGRSTSSSTDTSTDTDSPRMNDIASVSSIQKGGAPPSSDKHDPVSNVAAEDDQTPAALGAAQLEPEAALPHVPVDLSLPISKLKPLLKDLDKSALQECRAAESDGSNRSTLLAFIDRLVAQLPANAHNGSERGPSNTVVRSSSGLAEVQEEEEEEELYEDDEDDAEVHASPAPADADGEKSTKESNTQKRELLSTPKFEWKSASVLSPTEFLPGSITEHASAAKSKQSPAVGVVAPTPKVATSSPSVAAAAAASNARRQSYSPLVALKPRASPSVPASYAAGPSRRVSSENSSVLVDATPRRASPPIQSLSRRMFVDSARKENAPKSSAQVRASSMASATPASSSTSHSRYHRGAMSAHVSRHHSRAPLSEVPTTAHPTDQGHGPTLMPVQSQQERNYQYASSAVVSSRSRPVVQQQEPIASHESHSQSSNHLRFRQQDHRPTAAKPSKVYVVNGREYEVVSMLGRGGSSKVYMVKDSQNNIFALKRIKAKQKMSAHSRASYENEIALMKSFRGCPRIVQLYDSQISDATSEVFMVMEHGEVDLNQWLKNRAKTHANEQAPTSAPPLDVHVVRTLWLQMLEAMQVLHRRRVVHSDLKPANFVFVKGELKLIDFGIARAIESDMTENIHRDTQVGTLNFMPPEALEGVKKHGTNNNGKPDVRLGRSSDVWSLGCMLYQLVYGTPPFASLNLTQKIRAITNERWEIPFPATGAAAQDPGLVTTMRRCLQYRPKRRPPVEGLGGLLVPRDAADGNNGADLRAMTLADMRADTGKDSGSAWSSAAQQALMKASLRMLLRDAAALSQRQLSACATMDDSLIDQLMRTLVHRCSSQSKAHAEPSNNDEPNVLIQVCKSIINAVPAAPAGPPPPPPANVVSGEGAAAPRPSLNGGLLAALGTGAAMLKKAKKRKNTKKPRGGVKNSGNDSGTRKGGVGVGVSLSDILAVKDGLKNKKRRKAGATSGRGRGAKGKRSSSSSGTNNSSSGAQEPSTPAWALSSVMRQRRQALGDLSPATQTMTIHDDSFEW